MDEIEKSFRKQFGEDSILDFSFSKVNENNSYSTGSYQLNRIVSGNSRFGFVQGRMVELFGSNGTFKTTLALSCLAEIQKAELKKKNGRRVGYIDIENSMNPIYAKILGVQFDAKVKPLFTQPQGGEEAMEQLCFMAESGDFAGIVVDSWAACTPVQERTGDIGDSNMGRRAFIIQQGIRKSIGAINKNKVVVIGVNHLMMKLGVNFGNPEYTPGGEAPKFYSSYRIQFSTPRGGKIESLDKKSELGILVKMKTLKNKLYRPFEKADTVMLYGKGIDKASDLLFACDYAGVLSYTEKKVTCKGKKYDSKKLIDCMNSGSVSGQKFVNTFISMLYAAEEKRVKEDVL